MDLWRISLSLYIYLYIYIIVYIIYIYIYIISIIIWSLVINQVATWVAFLVAVNEKIIGATAIGIKRQRAYCPNGRLHGPIWQRIGECLKNTILVNHSCGRSCSWWKSCLIFGSSQVHKLICNLSLVYAFIFPGQKNCPGLVSTYRVTWGFGLVVCWASSL